MKTLFFIPIFLFFVNISFSQNVVNFVEEGVEFNLYLNGEFTYKVPNGVSKTTKNYNGQISSVGTVKITYDFSQRISKIGSVAIRFNFTNQIIQVGGLTINYDISGNLSSTSGQVNSPTNTNINSQAGNTNNQNQQTQSTIQTTTQSSQEKEHSKFMLDIAVLEADKVSLMKKRYDSIENKNVAIPDGYHNVELVYTIEGVTRTGGCIAYVENNQITRLVGASGNNKGSNILSKVIPKGKISLGRGYFEVVYTISETVIKTTKAGYEAYFIDYLKEKKMPTPYKYDGRIGFNCTDKRVTSSKYKIWVFAKHLNTSTTMYSGSPLGDIYYRPYEYIGDVVGEEYTCVFRATPSVYTFRFFVVENTKNGYEVVKFFDLDITLTADRVQGLGVTWK